MKLKSIYNGKKVLVTGHTGFKGSWLCEWLLALGARVYGLSLPPPTTPSLFDSLRLSERMDSSLGDIRDPILVQRHVARIEPNFIFHLAAQPLVRLSYEIPLQTYATNVMGTANVLEAVRVSGIACTVVVVTTDKCYENQEWSHSYREVDPMGGHDPYSSSKGAAELVVAAYRKSFFEKGSTVSIASARAGNVIGGGDWALDRIVPDCIRALKVGQSIPVRNRVATRPWQHVLEPLGGYLWLAGALSGRHSEYYHFDRQTYASPFNFGPALDSNRTVADLVQEVLRHWPGSWEDRSDPAAVHEAKLLNLSIDKAYHLLDWAPCWDFERTVQHTVFWYRSVDEDQSPLDLAQSQIEAYTRDAAKAHIAWAQPKEVQPESLS